MEADDSTPAAAAAPPAAGTAAAAAAGTGTGAAAAAGAGVKRGRSAGTGWPAYAVGGGGGETEAAGGAGGEEADRDGEAEEWGVPAAGVGNGAAGGRHTADARFEDVDEGGDERGGGGGGSGGSGGTKRPRVGRMPGDTLTAIDNDCYQPAGRSRHLRGMLLHIGAGRRDGEALATVLTRQGNELATALQADRDGTLDLFFDAVLSLPQYTPLLAGVAVVAAQAVGAEVGEGMATQVHRRLAPALAAGHPWHAKLLLRAAACWASLGLLQLADVVAQVVELVAAAEAVAASAAEHHADGAALAAAHAQAVYLVHTALAALPWLPGGPGAAGVDVAALQAVLARAGRVLNVVERHDEAAAGRHAVLLPGGHVVMHGGDGRGEAASPPAAFAALTPRRQHALGQQWLDVPADGATPQLAAAALSNTRKLHAFLTDSLAAAVASDAGAGAGAAVVEAAWGVATISRPHEDIAAAAAATAAMLPGANGAPPPLPPPAVRFYCVSRDAGGGWGVRPADAALAPRSLVVDQPAGPEVLGALPPASAWFVPPGMALFGEGGLSATPVVLRSLQLEGAVGAPLALWCLRDVAHDVLVTYHPFHGDAAAALVALPTGRNRPTVANGDNPGSPPAAWCAAAVSLGVEAVLMQQLWLPGPPVEPPFYTLVMLSLIAASTLHGALASNAIGLAARVLWKFAGALDDGLLPPLAAWMAHHTASTKWAWLWDDWKGALGEGVPAHDAQRRFLTELIQATFALVGPWHYDRIVADTFPSEYRAILPANTTTAARFCFDPAAVAPAASEAGATGDGDRDRDERGRDPLVADEAGDGSLQDAAEADILRHTGLARARSSGGGSGSGRPALQLVRPDTAAVGDAVMAVLRAKSDAGALAAAVASVDAPTLCDLDRLFVTAQCIWWHSRANLKNVTTLLERYRAVLTAPCPLPADAGAREYVAPAAGALPADELRAHVVLAALVATWRDAEHVVDAHLEVATGLGIVRPADVVSFALAPVVAAEATAPGGAAANLADAALPLSRWRWARVALAAGAAAARRDAVDLALARGAKVYDAKEEEVEEAVAVSRDAALVAKAGASEATYHAGVEAALRVGGALCRGLQVALVSALDTGAPAGAAREGLRIALAHCRDLLRRHLPVVAALVTSGAAVAAVEASASMVAELRGLSAAAADATGGSDLFAHVFDAAAAAATGATLRHLTVPSPLLRDRDLVQPLPRDRW